jgi:DNA repair exonuclease SbcCD ATPase subunit
VASLTPELYELILKIVDERVKEIKVTREEFDKLTKQVLELTKAIEDLKNSIKELIEIQKKFEERLAKLEEAQIKTEERLAKLEEAFIRAEERLAKLEEAQLKFEERLAKLEEAQIKTEERLSRLEEAVIRLAEAQERTEKTLNELAMSLKRLSEEFEGLKETVGFSLEDIARVVLPGWIERHLKIKVPEMERKFFNINRELVEVDLYAETKIKGESIAVIAEVKNRIRKKDVETFDKKFNKLKDYLKIKCIGILFGFLIYPDAAEEASKKKIYTVVSYQR